MSPLPTLSRGLTLRLKMKSLNETQKRFSVERLIANLGEIFLFLEKNRSYNHELQGRYYRRVLLPWTSKAEKVKSLLQHTWKNQSRPKLDDVLPTWVAYQNRWSHFDSVETVADLASQLICLVPEGRREEISENSKPLDTIWRSLCATSGFGPKTAALFVKALVEINTKGLHPGCSFLQDIRPDQHDKMRVPVDNVIIFIFERLVGQTLAFDQINELIFDVGGYKIDQSAVWDDLWFWGYITQLGTAQRRVSKMNKAKFFATEGAPWERWDEIEPLAERFINLLSRLHSGQIGNAVV